MSKREDDDFYDGPSDPSCGGILAFHDGDPIIHRRSHRGRKCAELLRIISQTAYLIWRRFTRGGRPA